MCDVEAKGSVVGRVDEEKGLRWLMKVAVFETGQTPRVATIRDPSSFPAFLECPDKDGRPDGRVRGGVVGWCRMVVGSRCCQRKQPKEEELGLAFDLERDPAVWSGSRGRGRARLEGWQLFCGPSKQFSTGGVVVR